MPNKRPPNAEATQFRTGEEQVEIARQGGLASGKARREKQKTQQIFCVILLTNIEKNIQKGLDKFFRV